LFAPPLPQHDIPWSESADRMLGDAARGGVVVFQKMQGPGTERLIRHLSAVGVTTAYVQCDIEPGHNVPALCDVAVRPTVEMARRREAQGAGRVECIPDPAEMSWPAPRGTTEATRYLRVCWVGHRVNFPTVDPIRAILREEEFHDLKLVTISNRPDA